MKEIKLDSIDLSVLKDFFKLIEIRLDNSVNVINEMGGPDYFYIRVDTSKNTAIPCKEDSDLSLMEQFTNADYAGIYEAYIENQSFLGMYSIASLDDNQEWCLDFQEGYLYNEEGEINENDKNKIVEVINPKSLYKLANEVLQACK